LNIEQSPAAHYTQRGKVIAALSVAALLVLALLAYLVWSGYQEAIRNAETTTRNYAAIIEARLDATLRRTEADLREMTDRIPIAALNQKDVAHYKGIIAPALKAHLAFFPELESIRIVDVNGDVIYYSDDDSFPKTNIADRDHFLKARDNLKNALVFSGVVDSRITGRPSIYVARTLRDANGVFRGVILAGINLDYFQHLFKSLDIGADGTISWRRTDDHRLVLRWPHHAADVNRRLNPQNPIVQKLTAGETVITQQFKSEVDGITRIYSTKALENYPFHINVGIGRDNALAAWRARSTAVGEFALVLLLLLAALLYRLWRAEDLLRANEKQFHDLTELSSDWYWEQDANLRFTAMSQELYPKGGLRPESTMGKLRWELPIMGVSQSEWRAHRETLERREPFSGFVYQMINEAGEVRWFSINGKPLFGANGEFEGYRGVGRDITKRRRAEIELARIHAELESKETSPK
jgi:PAS domain S-box-containing protein